MERNNTLAHIHTMNVNGDRQTEKEFKRYPDSDKTLTDRQTEYPDRDKKWTDRQTDRQRPHWITHKDTFSACIFGKCEFCFITMR